MDFVPYFALGVCVAFGFIALWQVKSMQKESKK